jgi:adenylate cyclase
MLETEKKFLVRSDEFKKEAVKATRITQGYLSSIPERTVRVRIKGDKGYLTIKGIGNESGASRFEWEKAIPVAEAETLLQICEPGVIEKIRYEIPAGKYTFEVDVFFGDNTGLTVAEIELEDENAAFDKPAWIGKEVTGDARYYNATLFKHPFKKW